MLDKLDHLVKVFGDRPNAAGDDRLTRISSISLRLNKNKTGIIIHIETYTKGATNPSDTAEIEVTDTLKPLVDPIEAKNNQIRKDIQDALNKGRIINQRGRTVTEVAMSIDSLGSLHSELGVDLPSLTGARYGSISATGNSRGELVVTVVVINASGTMTIKSKPIMGDDDASVGRNSGDAIQAENERKIKEAIRNGVPNQNGLTVASLVRGLSRATIENRLGIILPKLEGGARYGNVSATGHSDGSVEVSVETITPGATHSRRTVIETIYGTSDNRLNSADRDKDQREFLELIKKDLDLANLPEYEQGDLTVGQWLAKRTFNAGNPSNFYGRDGWNDLGLWSNYYSTSARVTKRWVTSDDATGEITLHIQTYTKGASHPNKTLTRTIYGKTANEVNRVMVKRNADEISGWMKLYLDWLPTFVDRSQTELSSKIAARIHDLNSLEKEIDSHGGMLKMLLENIKSKNWTKNQIIRRVWADVRPDGKITVHILTKTPGDNTGFETEFTGVIDTDDDATVLERLANIKLNKIKKIIADGSTNMKITNQGTRKTSEIAININGDKYQINKELNVDWIKIKRALSGLMIDGASIIGITAVSGNDGSIQLKVNVYIPNLGTKEIVIGPVTGKSDSDIDAVLSIANETNAKVEIKKALDKATLKYQRDEKVSDIAKRITTPGDLNIIDAGIPALKDTIIKSVVVTGDSNGNMTITVIAHTKGRPGDIKITKTIKGKSDDELLKVEKNKLQKDNVNAINTIIGSIYVRSSENRNADEIATAINHAKGVDSKLKEIRKATGINIDANMNGTEITDVTATRTTDGKIELIINTKTPGATNEGHEAKGMIHTKTDSEVEGIKANQKQTENNAKFQDWVNKLKIKSTENRNAKEIADDINNGKSIQDILDAIAKATGTQIPAEIDGTKIVSISAKSRDGQITITIKTATPNATETSHLIRGNVAVKTNAAVETLKKDKFKNKLISEIQKGNIKDKDEYARKISQGISGDIDNKISEISRIMGIALAKSENGWKIDRISTRGTEDGEIILEISISNANGTRTDLISETVSGATPDWKLNNKFIENKFKGARISDSEKLKMRKASEIVNDFKTNGFDKSIQQKLNAIKSWTGIDLDSTKGKTTITKIEVISTTSSGEINLRLTTTYGSHTETIDVKIGGGVTDTTVDAKRANEDQAKAIKTIKEWLKHAKENFKPNGKYGKTKAMDIVDKELKGANANDVDAIIAKLRKFFKTIPFTKTIGKTTITSIEISGKANGEITIVIKTNTPDATNNEGKAETTIQHKSNYKIDKEAKKAKQEQDMADHNKAYQDLLNNAKIKDSEVKTVDELVQDINDANKNLSDKIDELNGIIKSKHFPMNIGDTKITNIKASRGANDGDLLLEITTETTVGGTTRTKILTGVLKHKTDEELNVEKRDRNIAKYQNLLNNMKTKVLTGKHTKQYWVNEINDNNKNVSDKIDSVKELTGIKLPDHIEDTSLMNITAKINSNGQIELTLTMKTTNVSNGKQISTASVELNYTKKGKTAKEIADEANAAQKEAVKLIEAVIAETHADDVKDKEISVNEKNVGIFIENPGGLTASELAKKINGDSKTTINAKIERLGEITGIDLTDVARIANITSIVATASNGYIDIVITTSTPGATDKAVEIAIHAKTSTDEEIAKENDINAVKRFLAENNPDLKTGETLIQKVKSIANIDMVKGKEVKLSIEQFKNIFGREPKLYKNKIENVYLTMLPNGKASWRFELKSSNGTNSFNVKINIQTKKTRNIFNLFKKIFN